MDYKLNYLAKEIKCEEVGIPDLPDLKFGHLENGIMVFNTSDYIRRYKKEGDYRTFSRAMKFWIEQLATGYGVKTSELFYANPNGDELYHEIIVYLFLMYIDPLIITYFNDLIDDALTDGIAFSDSYIFNLAESRLPDDVKKAMLSDDRKKNSNIQI